MTISNLVAMIMAKPDKSVKELITPHLANGGIFVVSIITGLSVCSSCSPAWLSSSSASSEQVSTESQ